MSEEKTIQGLVQIIQFIVGLITGSVGFVLYGSTIEGIGGSIVVGVSFYVLGYIAITGILVFTTIVLATFVGLVE